jgi:hypothetical protein
MLEDYKMDRGKLSACEISNMTSHLCAIMDTAARACPNGKKNNKKHTWPTAVSNACKESKQQFWEWKQDGSPIDTNSLTF